MHLGMCRRVLATVVAGCVVAGLGAGRAAPPRQTKKDEPLWLPGLAASGPEAARTAVFSNG